MKTVKISIVDFESGERKEKKMSRNNSSDSKDDTEAEQPKKEAEKITDLQLIYHEVQTSRLCGVHAINSLLQGPYFTQEQMSAIAKELDQKEQAMLSMTNNNGKRIRSTNMDARGNFSIQVLNTALAVFDLTLSYCQQLQPHVKALICHMAYHWFALRNINNQWINLDSNLECPHLLSDTYVNMFLDSIREEGYIVFKVEGNLPEPRKPLSLKKLPSDIPEYGDWKQAAPHRVEIATKKNQRPNTRSTKNSKSREKKAAEEDGADEDDSISKSKKRTRRGSIDDQLNEFYADEFGGFEEDLPICKYGDKCYRTNPEHMKSFIHLSSS